MTVSPDGATFDGDFERPAPPPPPDASGRRGRTLPVAIALATGVVFAGSVWYAYYQGTQVAERSGEPPLISADPNPTKLRPDDPGGLKVPNQDKLVFQRMVTSQPDKRVERLLPPAETPVERPQSGATSPTGIPDTSAPKEVSVGTTTVVPPKITEKQNPPPVRTATLPKIAATPKPAPAPAQTATTAPAKTMAPAKSTAPVSLKPKTTVAAGPYGLQLASMKKLDGASVEWRRLQTTHKSTLSGLGSRVVRADLGSRGVFYRLVAGPYATQARARDACAKLKAQNQGCLVVKY